MKKFALVLAICMLLPLNAFALELLSEDIMGDVTGQAGVSIAIDDVKLFQNITELVYTDLDGVDGTPASGNDLGGGSIGIGNLSVMININAITRLDGDEPFSPGRATMGNYDASIFDYTNTVHPTTGTDIFISKALTIDAGALAVLSAGASANAIAVYGAGAPAQNVTGVRIGLPTVEIVQSDMTLDIIATSIAGNAANENASYGRIQIGQVTMAVLDGFVEIAPH